MAAAPLGTGVLSDSHGVEVVRGPYFEELQIGQVFDRAPSVTLTDGLAAAHQAIVGDRLRLSASHHLAEAVLGHGPVAPSALVWNVAIGQSSQVTQHVRANLYYRGLVLRRLPLLGDTLTTTTKIVGLKQNRLRPGRRPTGLVALHITTADQNGRCVLDFERCAMIPMLDQHAMTAHHEELTHTLPDVTNAQIQQLTEAWRIPTTRISQVRAGQRFRIEGRDVVTSAPELARLTMNIAAVHHDADAAGGRRLVYGGHTIALALAQASRALPELLAVVAWHSCDHLAAVHEEDRLSSELEVEAVRQLPQGGSRLDLRSRVWSHEPKSEASIQVLDWRFVAISA